MEKLDSSQMDRKPRYAPKTIYLHGAEQPVIKYAAYEPGAHPDKCPVNEGSVALEMKTEVGSRWMGFEKAYIDATLRMVVVGFPARDQIRSAWPIVEDTIAAEIEAATWDGSSEMTFDQAAEYAPQWGNGGTRGGCAMYNLAGGVESERHRADCLEDIDNVCIPMVEKTPADFDADEIDKLKALRAYVVSATSKNIDGDDEDFLADQQED